MSALREVVFTPEVGMQDLLLVVEAYLDQEGIVYSRNEDAVCFELPYGRTSYSCQFSQEGPVLWLVALWRERISEDRIGDAHHALSRLSNTRDTACRTLLNPAHGQVRFETSVDLTLAPLTIDRMDRIIETLLDPFNVKLLAMEYVLAGDLTEDDAASAYERWLTKRDAALLRRADGDGPDPSLN